MRATLKHLNMREQKELQIKIKSSHDVLSEAQNSVSMTTQAESVSLLIGH